MSLNLDALTELEALGWRLWNLHQHTKGYWEARVYNRFPTEYGANGDHLGPHASGATPNEAIRNAAARVLEPLDHQHLPHAAAVRLEAALDALCCTMGEVRA